MCKSLGFFLEHLRIFHIVRVINTFSIKIKKKQIKKKKN